MTVYRNYDDVLAQLRGCGLDVDHLEVGTTNPKRCKEIGGDREKRGWYWLSDIELTEADGTRAWYITGAFGIYRGADHGKFKVELRRDDTAVKVSAAERDAMKARQAQMQQQQKARRQAEINKAATRATRAWAGCVPEGDSAYLRKKRVQPHGLRFSIKAPGTLVVPMLDMAGRIWGLQLIRDGVPKDREKLYWPPGLGKVGHFHLLGAPTPKGVLLLAEGYATAATLHETCNLPCAVAFDAGNLLPAAKALAAGYPGVHILVCADDDVLQKCRACNTPTRVTDPACSACGQPHGQKNPGVEAAQLAALAVDGRVVAPTWPFERGAEKLTDWNDLANHPEGGPHLVRAQVWEAIPPEWRVQRSVPREPVANLGGGGRQHARSVMQLGDAIERFLPIDDGTGKAVFDTWTQRLVLREQMVALLAAGCRWDDVKRHPVWIDRGSYYLDQVGFDPAGEDANIKLNTWTGWTHQPAPGDCRKTLDLLRYLTSGEPNAEEVYTWILRWLAYPLQHPGAKLKSALVVHGPQGTGKSMVFEAVEKIYGDYGILLNQGAIEDKFNSDWSSRKLYVVADEIVARQDMHHIKNQLKTFITGDWIRVNPKNLPAYRERNHMNLVFLSNEKQPVYLENDDRRHLVIWTPPALDKPKYDAVAHELEHGGLAALHQHLLDLDLGDFVPNSRPPPTRAKADLQEYSQNSVERFVAEWRALQITMKDPDSPGSELVVPLCPCLGSHLYQHYRRWCAETGERDVGDKRLIGHLRKIHGWQAGESQATWDNFQSRSTKTRKLIVPNPVEMQESIEHCSTGAQERLARSEAETKKDWLTRCFFAFEKTVKAP